MSDFKYNCLYGNSYRHQQYKRHRPLQRCHYDTMILNTYIGEGSSITANWMGFFTKATP
jgi:hypothetical protein